MISLLTYFLFFPFPLEVSFEKKDHWRFICHIIITTLVLINLHLYYFNNYVSIDFF